ncbi:MAG: lysine exporter LysO family protein [Bacillota bacterium]|nr:lysine exporter LysO family protein [Bacillota bacterium]
MTKLILISVVCGMAAGHLFLPAAFIEASGTLLIIGLCILLFFVGVDIGTAGTVVDNFKKVGIRILAFPVAAAAGTFAGVALASFLLSMTVKDALAVGAGFGWYTLAPVILADYSTEVSAISFMHNVMREMLGIVLIPIVAKRVGYLEATALPGAAAMDVCLPVVERATSSDVAVYSFVMGVTLSFLVPLLVPLIIGL